MIGAAPSGRIAVQQVGTGRPPGTMGGPDVVPSREWSYDTSRGALVARTWELPEADPRYVALLAHGYGEHIGRYEHVAEALVRAGAVVYGVDHIGHGKSDGERVLVQDFEDVVEDFHHLDEVARREHPGLPVVLVGHSMGGLIAARYAQRYGDSLAAVVLSGPLVGTYDAAEQLLAMDEIPNVPLDITTLATDTEVGRRYAEDSLVWHGPFKRPTLEAMLRALATIQAGPSLGRLPLLWVHGVEDPLVPLEGSRPGVEHLRGDVFEQHLYEGDRHEVFNERNQDEVLGDVVAFIDRALAG